MHHYVGVNYGLEGGSLEIDYRGPTTSLPRLLYDIVERFDFTTIRLNVLHTPSTVVMHSLQDWLNQPHPVGFIPRQLLVSSNCTWTTIHPSANMSVACRIHHNN